MERMRGNHIIFRVALCFPIVWCVCMCICVWMLSIIYCAYPLISYSQWVFVEQRNTHFWYQDAETSKDWAKITLLQTFHNAAQLNWNSAWLFGSLFTPTTLLQSHTSNYLRTGVSTYGYDSFRLTTAINRGVRDQNCSSESVTDDRYGKRFSMIFCTHGGGGMERGKRGDKGWNWKKKKKERDQKNQRKVSIHMRCCGTRHVGGQKPPLFKSYA